MSSKKIVLIGCGAVGSSFIYSALNQKLANEYVLIDKFKSLAQGNILDFNDSLPYLADDLISVKTGDFNECSNADLIVITAGRPRKIGESRLDMVSDNARIMKEIALEIKASGFNGITIIASNPVDIMTSVYQKVTGFDIHKVVGSGTILDTLRLKTLLAQKLNVAPKNISSYVLGEHGDSSFVNWSSTKIINEPITKLLSQEELAIIEQDIRERASQIIKAKGATFYGIATGLTFLATNILNNSNVITIAGAYLNGQYNNKELYLGVPVRLNANGWQEIIEVPLSKEEQIKFNNSCSLLKKTLKVAYQAIE